MEGYSLGVIKLLERRACLAEVLNDHLRRKLVLLVLVELQNLVERLHVDWLCVFWLHCERGV